MAEKLKDRVVLITGASRGIGQSLAWGFGQEGALLVLAARHEPLLQNVADEIQANGGTALVVRTDISVLAEVEHLVDMAVERFKRIDVLINNAAVLLDHHSLMETSTEHWLQTLATNLTGAFFCCREVIPVMRRQQYGRIINVTSGLSVNNLPNYGAYNVSKAGLNALTRTLAAELQGTGILVNGLDPGVVRSNMSPTASTPPEEVMPGALFLATLPPDGPTGRFFNKRGDERGW